MPDPAPQNMRPRRWPQRLGIAVLLLVAGLFWLWNGPGGVAAAELAPSDRTRLPDGSWPSLPDEGALSLSVAATSTQSQTNHTASMARSSSAGARFASRSFLVRAPAGDPLTDAITRRVIAALEQDVAAQRLAFLPDGSEPAPGGLAPDIVIRIARVELERDTFLGTGKTRARVRATASNDLTAPRHRYHAGSATQRTIEFALEIDADTNIDSQGIATPGAQLEAVADGLAKAVVDSLRSHLADLRAAHAELPALPAGFWPAFRPVEATSLPLASLDELERLASWRGLLLPNETWWHGVVPRTADEVLDRFAEQAVAAGFTRIDRGASGLLFTRGTQELLIFLDEPPRERGVTVQVFEPAAQPGPASTPVFLRYREHLTTEEIARAIDATLLDDAAPGLLTLYAPAWNADQRQRGRALLEASAQLELDGLLLRANLRAKDGDMKAAAADLVAATLLAKTTFGQDAPEKRVEKVAEQLEIELAQPAPTAELLLAAGYLQLTAVGETIEREVLADRPLRWFVLEDGRPLLFGLGLLRDERGGWSGTCRMVDGGTRSEISALGQGVTNHFMPGDGSMRIEILTGPADGSARALASWER